jgi:hypothetical protein
MDMLDNPSKIVGVLAIGSFVAMVVFAGMAFFITPHYKELVDTAVAAFKDVFLIAAGVKAGLSLPHSNNSQ